MNKQVITEQRKLLSHNINEFARIALGKKLGNIRLFWLF